MNVETQRKNIVHRILEVQDLNLLNQIEALLDNDIYTYSTAGKPLTVKEYKNHLDEIMIASDAGKIGYSSEDAKSKIQKK